MLHQLKIIIPQKKNKPAGQNNTQPVRHSKVMAVRFILIK